ncbi:hypothetical protein [Amycolatopsis sp. NPDC059657]|uniref:hypothetical protein n=1 Tax=Amycolatopsis sp. NPDC059657 TaxID=3346899 RepID=UPI00366B859B
MDSWTADLAVGPAVGLGVGSPLAITPPGHISAGQSGWARLAQKADLFSRAHDRQVMPRNSAPQALGTDHLLSSSALWWVTTAVVAIAIAVYVLHRHLRSRHLRSRVRYDLLPTATFDPTVQGILAVAHQLGRVRPVHGWVPRSVVGVRIRFSTDDLYGKMTMSVEGRASITGVINKLSYPDVEIRRSAPADDDQGETTAGEGDVSPAQRRGETTSPLTAGSRGAR